MGKLLTGLLSTLSGDDTKNIQKPAKSKKPKQKKIINKRANEEAQSTAKEIIILAREEAAKIREQAKRDLQSLQQSQRDLEERLKRQQSDLDIKNSNADTLRNNLEQERQQLEKTKEEITNTKRNQLEKLEKIGKLTKDQAKKILLDSLEKHLTKDAAERIRESEEKIKEEADEKAKEILIDSLYHGATDYVAEYTVSTVKLKDEDIKGRIIGKDGRNIRAFEKATGVDLDMDENPGEVRLSCFDPVRREIARVALERLIKDGRIQPTRIDEYVAKVKKEIDKIVFEEGKKLCHTVGAYKIPHELIALLGKFKYRTSYGQNMISHTLEETKIGMKLASEVGVDVDTVRLGCLFHDIGKVVNEEGSHVELGVKVLKKFNMPQAVVDAVAQHHEDEEFSSFESIVVYIADAISGARPGARYENYDEYVKRLTKIEEIATSKDGVQEAYAIQAGREVRVIVDPQQLSDDAIVKLAHDIKNEIKENVTYPGTVTVNVIRETRATDVAK